MRYGTIIQYFPDKKFGFIRPDSGRDIFFHISALGEEAPPLEIKPEQPVKYELTSLREMREAEERAGRSAEAGRDRGPQAKLVSLIDKLPGGSISDVDQEHKPARHPRARKKKPTWRR
jgi:cold shock CspA family protein